TFSDGQQLQTALLILADGARSELAQQLGIQHSRKTYGTHALVTQVQASQPHQHCAYERFSEHGPIAFLPLNQRDYAVVWTLPDEQIDTVLALPDAEFLRSEERRVGEECRCQCT